MIKKRRPARSHATQGAERRAPIEQAIREIEVLEEALKKYSEQVRSLRLAREAILADLRGRSGARRL